MNFKDVSQKIMTLAGCIITDPDGRILLLHRNTPQRVQWEIPGGKVGKGESTEAAAIREIKEELGVNIRTVKLIGSKEFSEGNNRFHYTWFRAEVVSGKPKVMEPKIFDDLRYFSVNELIGLPQSLGLQNFLQLIRKYEWRKKTIATYNQSAQQLADYFRGIGSRTQEIDLAVGLAGHPKDANVLEIGCGDGRDAKEIVQRTKNYTGFDISEELIKLAKLHVPGAKFEIADASTYSYPANTFHIVFAFASLLHLDKDEVKELLMKIYKSLKANGIFYISLKYAPRYQEKIKEDQYGSRMFYFYNPALITALAGKYFDVIYQSQEHATKKDVVWFNVALRKR